VTTQEQPSGRRISWASATLQNAATALHILLYRITNGAIGGSVAKSPVLLLTAKGRKSSKPRTVPLLYLKDNGNVVLVASNGGAAKHPTWFLNLRANPEAEVQIGAVRRTVRAEQASAAEKQRLWPFLTAMYPGYARYQGTTNRDIPVVILRSI
jgi:deazaflavin-dependent oxidoreductase (nitroreductase family)